ncbi:MAG: penicillin-binding protein 2 [Pseudomonadota bacterium]
MSIRGKDGSETGGSNSGSFAPSHVHLPDADQSNGKKRGRSFFNQPQSIVIQGARKQRNDLIKNRIFLIAFVFLGVYCAIFYRLTDLATNVDGLVVASVPTDNTLMIARPDLVDRNGEVMAKDLTTFSLYADPTRVKFPQKVVSRLKSVLPELEEDRIVKRLNSQSRFVWIDRELTPLQHQRILDLGLPGLGFHTETRRFYPGGRVASHVVGHVNIDNTGIAGFEKFVDDTWLQDLRDVGLSLNQRMKSVPLSIDMRVQHVVRDELIKAMDRYQAIAAVGIVLDAQTGEVVAMSSLPDYDPNNPKKTLNDDTLNRATAGVFEMGSTFKTLTTAMALDHGGMSMSSMIDARKPIRKGGHTINDFHAKARVLSLPEVFIYSSNIGTVKLADSVGVQGHRAFLENLGLLTRADHELPESGKPLSPRKWSELASMTIAFGHGVSVTPLQTIAAAAAMVNGGKLIPPTFRPRTKVEADQLAKQVISQKTSEEMRYLFRLNVEKGSGRRAEVPGFFVGGKTGTAEKVVNGRYDSDKRLNSFLSAFPADDPRYVMLVMLDEPQPMEGQRSATAGLNTAPTTAAIIRRVAITLGVPPRLPRDQRLINVAN